MFANHECMYDVRENEHQELFYLGIDPRQPVPVHIPSPLRLLGYFIYVRAAESAVQRLERVSTRLDIGGLREDHVTVGPGEGVSGSRVLIAKERGLVWICLGCAQVSRGNGVMNFIGWPEEVGRADLLLCTWPRFVESGMADDWISARSDPAWAPSGVPLGGIGGGRIDICRDGRFRNFSMNNNQDAPLEDSDGLRGAYLAVQCGDTVRDLASRPIVEGHGAVDGLEFDARFPQARLKAQPFPGIEVTVTLSGTLCPHDLRRSSIPGFLVRWDVTNTGDADQTVTCRMDWPNLIGIGGGIAEAESGIGYGDGYYHHWDDPTGRSETEIRRENFSAIRFSGNPAPQFLSSRGEHLLGASQSDGSVPETACGGGRGEVSVTLTVPTGGKASAMMALVAAMPHWVDSLGVDRGRYWQNQFADGEAMLAALLAEADDILRESGALAEHLDDGTLPEWLRKRLSNCCYPLVTNSVHYRDGRFSINEGPTEMGGCYGTIDQRLAAHQATLLLLPELNAEELRLFAHVQAENGGINHDLGNGHLERKLGEMTWPDLTCSFIIQCARHAWSTGDNDFGQEMWPHARRALLRHAKWAEAGNGVAQVGKGLGTSYDSYEYCGTTGYMATLWLAALAVCRKWAKREADMALIEDIERWREAAVERLVNDLWNGRYFDAYGSPDGPRRETCHAGQLAGQVFARLLCGKDVLDEKYLSSAVAAMLDLNGSDRFAVPPDEVDPNGDAASDFGWLPYVEAFMLAAAASCDEERVMRIWRRMIEAADRDGSSPCDTRLMYRPLTGEPSWGAYYMTAPASWLVYEALLGFSYETEADIAMLEIRRPGRYPLVHPLFWGTADVAEDGQVTITLRREFAYNSPA